MFAQIEEVREFIKQKGLRFIDLKYCDLIGQLHHITLPAARFNKRLYTEGIGFDSSSTPGFKSLEAGDMVLIPVLSTAFVDPFFTDMTLSFLCNICEADSRVPYRRNPRYIATLAEEHLKSTGIATESRWSPEFEYYIFDRTQYQNNPAHCSYQIDSPEANHFQDNARSHSFGYQLNKGQGYHAAPPNDILQDIRSETVRIMEQCGIPVKYHHHEVGHFGQVEIEVLSGGLLFMADVVILTKYIARMVARRHGKTACFMPKPIYDEAGNGMHFHQQLYKHDTPIFYDEQGYGGLSSLALSYVAGILKHAPAMVAFTNPATNSYKRLVPGYEAPVSLFFSSANRSSAVRIPKYATRPENKRIEFRPPDATCNPYLAMSAMLLAGVDGIKHQFDISEEGFGPYDMNLFAEEHAHLRKKIAALPARFDKALDNLREKHNFLTSTKVFQKDVIDAWIEYKIAHEIEPLRKRPTPFEFQLYYSL